MYLSNFASCNCFYHAVCFEIINLALSLLYDTREDDAFGFRQDMVGFTGDALESLLTVSLSKYPVSQDTRYAHSIIRPILISCSFLSECSSFLYTCGRAGGLSQRPTSSPFLSSSLHLPITSKLGFCKYPQQAGSHCYCVFMGASSMPRQEGST